MKLELPSLALGGGVGSSLGPVKAALLEAMDGPNDVTEISYIFTAFNPAGQIPGQCGSQRGRATANCCWSHPWSPLQPKVGKQEGPLPF
jgi:hypothetical protein